MDKYRKKLKWNNELKILREEQEKQRQKGLEPIQRVKIYEYSDSSKEERKSSISKVILLFAVISGGVFTGGFILFNVLGNMFTSALKEQTAVMESSNKEAIKELNNNLRAFEPKPISKPRVASREFNYSSPVKKWEPIKIERSNFKEAPIIDPKEEAEKIRRQEADKLRREEAFKAFYQKPEHCLTPETQGIKMDCINDFIKAKRDFEMSYRN